jgi:hypothetical protein
LDAQLLGYGKFGGTKATADDLEDMFGRLEVNEMIQTDGRVITGKSSIVAASETSRAIMRSFDESRIRTRTRSFESYLVVCEEAEREEQGSRLCA